MLSISDLLIARAINGGGSGGGGGNPNSRQTITATLDDPWGDVSVQDLFTAINAGNATAELAFFFGEDAYLRAFLIDAVDDQSRNIIKFEFCNFYLNDNSPAFAMAAEIVYLASDGSAILAAGYDAGSGSVVDMASLLSYMPCTLTITWHPLPGS